MKKLLIFILSLLVVVSSNGLTACKNDSIDSEVVIASFESFEELFTMQFIDYFGEVELSDKYVTNGKTSVFWDINCSSMNLWPIHTKNLLAFPTLILFPENVGVNNIQNVDCFAIDVFNAGDSDVYLGIKVLDGNKNSSLTGTKTVEKGVQKTLRFYKDDLFAYETNSTISQIKIMLFNEVVNTEGMKIYFDNFRAVKSQSNEVCDAKLEGDIIVDFKSLQDAKYAQLVSPTDIEVAIKGNKNGALSLTWLPTRGYSNLIMSKAYTEEQNKVKLSFCKELLKLLDLNKVKTLSVDIYNDCIETKRVDFWYISGKKTYQNTIEVQGNKWTTVSVDLENTPSSFGLAFNTADNTYEYDTFIKNLRFSV